MGMGFAPTWLRQASPTPASHDHFNHWIWITFGWPVQKPWKNRLQGQTDRRTDTLKLWICILTV